MSAALDMTKGHLEFADEGMLRAYLGRLGDLARVLPAFLNEYLYQEGIEDGRADYLEEVVGEWRHALQAFKLKYQMSLRYLGTQSNLIVDRAHSGFPLWQEFVSMEQDATSARDTLEDLRSPDEIRQSMMRMMLRDGVFPGDLQYAMSHRLYIEHLTKSTSMPTRSALTVKTSDAGMATLQWHGIDTQSGMPMIYQMTAKASRGFKFVKGDRDAAKIKRMLFGAFYPEAALDQLLRDVDQAFDALHPIRIDRFEFTPFLSADVSLGDSTLLELMRNWLAGSTTDWSLSISHRWSESIGEETLPTGVFSTQVLQTYTEPDCSTSHLMTQPVYHALWAHEQAKFAGQRKYFETGTGEMLCHAT